jgi:hypothetical protein
MFSMIANQHKQQIPIPTSLRAGSPLRCAPVGMTNYVNHVSLAD